MANAFSRIAYGAGPNIDPASIYSKGPTDGSVGNPNRRPATFSGGDLEVWFNNRLVANLEAITWSTSIEVVGLYGMGSRDPRGFTKGKRVIVGSMSMQQYDRHALLEEVFEVTTGRNPVVNQGALWGVKSAGRASLVDNSQVTVYGRTGGGSAVISTYQVNPFLDGDYKILDTSAARGLTEQQARDLFAEQLRFSAQQKAALPIDYVDQLPDGAWKRDLLREEAAQVLKEEPSEALTRRWSATRHVLARLY